MGEVYGAHPAATEQPQHAVPAEVERKPRRRDEFPRARVGDRAFAKLAGEAEPQQTFWAKPARVRGRERRAAFETMGWRIHGE